MAKKAVVKKIESFDTAILVPKEIYEDIIFEYSTIFTKEQFLECAYYCISGSTPAEAVEAVTGDPRDYKRLLVWQQTYSEMTDAAICRRLNMIYKKGSALLQAHVYQLALTGAPNVQIQAARLLIDMRREHDKARGLKEQLW